MIHGVKRFHARGLPAMAPEDLINEVAIALERMVDGYSGRRVWQMSGPIVLAPPPLQGFRFETTSAREPMLASPDGPAPAPRWSGVLTLECTASFDPGGAALAMKVSDSQYWYKGGGEFIVYATLVRIQRHLIESGRATLGMDFVSEQGPLPEPARDPQVRAVMLNAYGAGDDWRPPARPVGPQAPALTSWGGREGVFARPPRWFERNIRAIFRSAGFEQIDVEANKAFGAIQRQGPGPLSVRYSLMAQWSAADAPGSSHVMWRVLNDVYSPGVPNAELAQKVAQQIELAVQECTPPPAGSRILLGPGEQLPDDFLDYADQYDTTTLKDYSGLTREAEAAALLGAGPLTFGAFARFGFSQPEPISGAWLGWGDGASAATGFVGVFGLAGSGKSSLLAHWARQANAAGWDVLALDPAGGLSDQLPMKDFNGPVFRFISSAPDPTGPRPDFLAMLRDDNGPNEDAAALLAEALLPDNAPGLTPAELTLQRRRLAALALVVELWFLHQPDCVGSTWPALPDLAELLADEQVLARAIIAARTCVPERGAHRRLLNRSVARLVDLLGSESLPDEGRRAARDTFAGAAGPLVDALAPFGAERSLYRRSGAFAGLDEFDRSPLPVAILFQTRPLETALFGPIWALVLANLRHLLHQRAQRQNRASKKLLILIDGASRIPGFTVTEWLHLVRDGSAHGAVALLEPHELASEETAARALTARLTAVVFLRRTPPASFATLSGLLGNRPRRALSSENVTGPGSSKKWSLRDFDGPYFTQADLEPLPGKWPALVVANADRPRPILTELLEIATAQPAAAGMPLLIAHASYRALREKAPTRAPDLAAITVSPDAPGALRTLTDALARALPHATITIHSGVYREQLWITRPVRLVGAAGSEVILTGEFCPLTVQARGVEIANLTVHGSPVAARVEGALQLRDCRIEVGDVEITRRGASLRMRACILSGGALRLHPGAQASVSQGAIVGSPYEAVSLTEAVVELRDCLIARAGKCAVSLVGGTAALSDCALVDLPYGLIVSHDGEATLQRCRVEAMQNIYVAESAGRVEYFDTVLAPDLTKPGDAA